MFKNIVLFGIMFFLVAGNSWGSVVVLKNGDRISGNIVEDTAEAVKINSDVLGEISINKEKIESVLTDDEAKAKTAEVPAVVEVKAQEEIVAPPAPKIWEHKVSAGYNSTNGNTKTSAANVTVDTHYKKGRNDVNIKSSLDYASDKGRMTTQKFYSKAKSDFRLKEDSKWFNTRAIELNHDKFSKIDYRILPSIGIGYWLWEGENSKSEIDLGIGYEYTNYNTPNTKATGNFSLIPHFFIDKVLIGKSKISQDITVYPSLESFSDYRLRSETALINPLSDTLSFKLSFIDEYNSTPKSNAKKNDTTFMSSIQYAF